MKEKTIINNNNNKGDDNSNNNRIVGKNEITNRREPHNNGKYRISGTKNHRARNCNNVTCNNHRDPRE